MARDRRLVGGPTDREFRDAVRYNRRAVHVLPFREQNL